jgi:hypothetical protein
VVRAATPRPARREFAVGAGSTGRALGHVQRTSSEAVCHGGAEVRLVAAMLTGQITTVAAEAGVDRSTIMTLRKTARVGAIAALHASRPGRWFASYGAPPGSRLTTRSGHPRQP